MNDCECWFGRHHYTDMLFCVLEVWKEKKWLWLVNDCQCWINKTTTQIFCVLELWAEKKWLWCIYKSTGSRHCACVYLFIYIRTLVERSRWAISASQWQLWRFSLHLRSSRMQLWMSDCSFTQHVLKIHQSGYSAVSIVTWLVPHETAAITTQVLCTPYQHAPVYSATVFKAAWLCRMHWTKCVSNLRQVPITVSFEGWLNNKWWCK